MKRAFFGRAGIIYALLLVHMFFGGCLAAEGTGQMNQETTHEERPRIRITTVRYNERDARDHLTSYIFGGYRAPPRVPRGIEPEQVSRFIIEELEPGSPPDAYRKTVNVLRFYERADSLPHLRKILIGQEKSSDDVSRSAYVCQAMGEIGSEQEREDAARYFEANLAGHPKAIEAVEVLLETLVVLSPSVTPDLLSETIGKEVDAKRAGENESEEGMRAFQQVASIERLKLPNALFFADEKKKVLALEGAERQAELLKIYMGLSNVSDELMMTWAARKLRRQAMVDDPEVLYEAFGKEIEQVDPEKIGKDPLTDTLVSRAGQAILYLQGKLSKEQRTLYEKTKLGSMNFLWDDLAE